MGRMPPHRPETSAECSSRIRDNKRRHRARQKEYVLELQRTVAETRERGVQVTKEVQIAAQGVARENAKLRDLLRWAGYTDDVVDAWVKGDTPLHNAERPQPVPRSALEEIGQKVPLAFELQQERKLEARVVSVMDQRPVLREAFKSGERMDKDLPATKSCLPSAAPSEKAHSPVQHPDRVGAPCKLITLLTKNPAADITQVPIQLESSKESYGISNPEDCNSDGIECYAAYNMLMQYATSSESMDRIATALESGCTPSATGGCKVKKSVVWSALDEECA